MVVTGIIGEKLAIEKLREEIPSIKWQDLLNNKHVKDYDIIGKNKMGKSIKIQVKTIKSGNWSLHMKKFLLFDREKLKLKKPEQWITGINTKLKETINFFIFVYLEGFFEKEPELKNDGIFIRFNKLEPKFYIIDTESLQRLLKKEHSRWLIKKEHKRPKNPFSFHSGLSKEDLEEYESKWEIIEKDFRLSLSKRKDVGEE